MTLIAIPALGCGAGQYDEVAGLLAPQARLASVVATEDRLEACVAQVLAAAPDRFVLMGTSFGGRVALETALAAPERVTGLIVIGASAGPIADRAVGLARGRRMRGGEFDQVLAEMGAMVAHLPGPQGPATRDAFIAMAQAMGAEGMARQSDALAHRGDLWPRLASLAMPVLCLWGREDKFTAAAQGLSLSQAVARGRYVEIAECGHFPSLEYPQETAAIIGHWLTDHGLERNRL